MPKYSIHIHQRPSRRISTPSTASFAEVQQARTAMDKEAAESLASAGKVVMEVSAERDRANELLRRALTTLVDVTSSGGWDQACELHATITAHLKNAAALEPGGPRIPSQG